MDTDIVARQVGLNAIAQVVVERYLGNRRVYRDLKLRLIDLQQGGLDDPIVRLICIDQQRIVDGVRRDPHVLQYGLAVAGTRAATAVECAGSADVRAGFGTVRARRLRAEARAWSPIRIPGRCGNRSRS